MLPISSPYVIISCHYLQTGIPQFGVILKQAGEPYHTPTMLVISCFCSQSLLIHVNLLITTICAVSRLLQLLFYLFINF